MKTVLTLGKYLMFIEVILIIMCSICCVLKKAYNPGYFEEDDFDIFKSVIFTITFAIIFTVLSCSYIEKGFLDQKENIITENSSVVLKSDQKHDIQDHENNI